MVNSISVTIPNPTTKQLSAIVDLLNSAPGSVSSTTVATNGNTSLSGLASGSKKGVAKTRTRKTNDEPEDTVSEDEDENFGKEAIDEDDIEMEVSDEDSSEDEEDEAEEDALDFATVKKAGIAFQKIKPKGYLAVLASFDCKTMDELKAKKNKWEPAYKKFIALTKESKKRH